MYKRLLAFLRCPECGDTLELVPLNPPSTAPDEEISEGLLSCSNEHWFPVVRGIPRMLPDALAEHWGVIEAHIPDPAPQALRPLIEKRSLTERGFKYDSRTRDNFAREWEHHELGGRTWGMDLQDRIKWFFLEPLHIPVAEMEGKVMLDAGCGNGSQSVAYTGLGLEVIAVDLSSGLEHGQALRALYPGAKPSKVHFIQADLQHPPLAPESVDIIHSTGVLHHTPDTHQTFQALRPLLRPGGTFYVWLYKYERLVTPVVNSMRTVTTRIPPAAFTRISKLMALPFMGFCAAVNALGVRSYPRLNRREAALALMDIFGAPYAHYHSYEEVAAWYEAEGFDEVWGCNDGRRGFGVCGRLAAARAEENREALEQPVFAVGQGGKI